MIHPVLSFLDRREIGHVQSKLPLAFRMVGTVRGLGKEIETKNK